MKFLCVPCDVPMRMSATTPPDRGSISVVYACPTCGYEIAMLTNPFETQLVQSLGVRIAPASPDGAAATGPVGESRCPFPAMVQGAGEAVEPDSGRIGWTPEASARLQVIPSFVREMARTGIEKFARERGYARVDEAVLDEAKAHFGM